MQDLNKSLKEISEIQKTTIEQEKEMKNRIQDLKVEIEAMKKTLWDKTGNGKPREEDRT